jgi:ferredoxin-2, mitochondrial
MRISFSCVSSVARHRLNALNRSFSFGVFRHSTPRHHGSSEPTTEGVLIRWFDRKTNVEHKKYASIGSTLLEAAHQNGIDLEGACEGSIACSTCHVILQQDVFDSLDDASEDEDDMLDIAFGLTETWVFGCWGR